MSWLTLVCRRESRGSNCAKTGKMATLPPCAALSVSLTWEVPLLQRSAPVGRLHLRQLLLRRGQLPLQPHVR